jgi:gamma-glutamylcyclotransferase (GGCT)/AIG2-like uncharacterized protein YtfP
MDDSLKFIYHNYTQATSFRQLWYAFERCLDVHFPHEGSDDNFRRRFSRLEAHLAQTGMHEHLVSRLYSCEEARRLAELQPCIYREKNRDTSAHKAFSSDFARYVQGSSAPKEPIARLLNLLYIVRCNDQHGQKPLPKEWDDMRERNFLVFSLTKPLLRVLDEFVIAFFVSDGVFTYGTLKMPELGKQMPYPVSVISEAKIKGHLYDLGRFPGWTYDTWGWVYGEIAQASQECRLDLLQRCDELEGALFERRLVVTYDSQDREKGLAWAYHYQGDTEVSQRISDGKWTPIGG